MEGRKFNLEQFSPYGSGILKLACPSTPYVVYIVERSRLKVIDNDVKERLSTHGVYCLIDGVTPTYIGKADAADKGVYGRTLEHLRNPNKKFSRVAFLVSFHPDFPMTPIVGNIEDYFISTYNPLSNKAAGNSVPLSESNEEAFKTACGQLESALESQSIYPNPVPKKKSTDIRDKVINSPNKPRETKKHSLLKEHNLKVGDELVFILDRTIHAIVASEYFIKVFGSDGKSFYDKFTLTSFCTTWNIETGRRKLGEKNTMDGPKYWETLDGNALKS